MTYLDAIRTIIHERLEALGLRKTAVPAVEPDSGSKHVDIFISENLKDAETVFIVFGECTKDLGLVAGRIAGGSGGINKGSMVGAVKALHHHAATGIILANMGEPYWSPEYKRAMTATAGQAVPMPSLVHMAIKYNPQVNDVPGSESPLCHARTIFNTAVAEYANKTAKINIVAVGDSCEVVASLLDEEQIWTEWGPCLQGALFYSPAFYHEPKQAGLKAFLAKVAHITIHNEQ